MDVLDLDVWAALRSYATYSTQNSLPSGSRITVRSAPASTTVAPRETRRATSNRTSPCARRSKCMRFLAVFGSGTRTNHMFGPPQPGASTYARSKGSPVRRPSGGAPPTRRHERTITDSGWGRREPCQGLAVVQHGRAHRQVGMGRSLVVSFWG